MTPKVPLNIKEPFGMGAPHGTGVYGCSQLLGFNNTTRLYGGQ